VAQAQGNRWMTSRSDLAPGPAGSATTPSSGPVTPAGIRMWPRPPASLFDGFLWGGGQWWPARPLIIRTRTYRDLCALTGRAAQLVLASCRRRAGTAGELREALGVPAGQLPLLDPDEPLGEHLLASMRPDIVTVSGVPKIVELNIDGAVGAAGHADFLTDRFLEFYRAADIAGVSALTAPPPAVETRSGAIRSCLDLKTGARVVIPVFGVGIVPGLEDPQKFIEWLEPVCESGRRHGLDMIAFRLDRLATDSQQRLLADGRVIDGVLRLFDAFSQPASPGLDALIRAVRARTARMFTPEVTILLTNKMPLAWLWEDIDRLDGDDREFVRRHIPWTVRFEAAHRDQAVARQADLVLKPVDGYGGTGVLVGPAVPAAGWRAGLDTAAADGSHILQDFIDGDMIAMGFTHARTGEARTARVGFVLGPFVFGGKGAAVLVRHGTPGTGAVLNAMQGAFPNTALLTADDAGAADL
jgi:hypothetical protein